jgi:alpha-methylacyl-CoA racemase
VTETQPLNSIRVICTQAMGPIPHATMLLGDLGADVIRIDRATTNPELTGLRAADDPRTRGHRAIGIDLKQSSGVDLVHRLVDTADVFIEGMRPGVAKRLRIGPETLLDRRPSLVYAHMTGWGQTGALAANVGHDINYAAMSGALHPIGDVDRPPTVPLNYLADFGGGGAYLVIGILAALHARATTGRGQVIDCAMVDGSASLTAMLHGMMHSGAWCDTRAANLLDGSAPFYRTYETSDGKYIAVGALEPQFYAAFITGLGLDLVDWPQHDRSLWPQQSARLATIIRARTRQAWVDDLAGVDACVSPVLSLIEAANAPELRERGTFVEWEGLAQPAPAPRFSTGPWPEERPRAGRYSHTDTILEDLGFPKSDIAQMRRDAIVA